MLPSGSSDIEGGALPVNGTSGITLDGTQNFTLSADVTNLNPNNNVGIYLSSSVSVGNAIADLELGGNATIPPYLAAAENETWNAGTPTTVGGGSGVYDATNTVNLALVYNATAGDITFEVNGSPNTIYYGTDTIPITPAQIASLRDVGFTFWYEGADQATIDNFTLTVASVPEPASIGLVAVGALALLGRRRRKETLI